MPTAKKLLRQQRLLRHATCEREGRGGSADQRRRLAYRMIRAQARPASQSGKRNTAAIEMSTGPVKCSRIPLSPRDLIGFTAIKKLTRRRLDHLRHSTGSFRADFPARMTRMLFTGSLAMIVGPTSPARTNPFAYAATILPRPENRWSIWKPCWLCNRRNKRAEAKGIGRGVYRFTLAKARSEHS